MEVALISTLLERLTARRMDLVGDRGHLERSKDVHPDDKARWVGRLNREVESLDSQIKDARARGKRG